MNSCCTGSLKLGSKLPSFNSFSSVPSQSVEVERVYYLNCFDALAGEPEKKNKSLAISEPPVHTFTQLPILMSNVYLRGKVHICVCICYCIPMNAKVLNLNNSLINCLISNMCCSS